MKEFYSEWKKTRDRRENDQLFVQAFLNRGSGTLSFMDNNYSHEQYENLLTLLQCVPTELFFESICSWNHTFEYDTSAISQFSDFEKGAIVVPQILEFYPEGINFTELGEKLIAAKEKEANRKYGENHASLASLMSLATIAKKQRKLVFPTGLGHFLIDYTMNEKNKLLKAMLLRNPFIQAIVRVAITGCGSYGTLMNGLAGSTARRRRQSIRHLLEFILNDTDNEKDYHSVDWTV